MEEQSKHDILKYGSEIDLLLLLPEITLEETLKYCSLAVDLKLGSVYIKPCYLQQVMDAIRGSVTIVGTVIGFPYGANAIQAKTAETKYALTAGVRELALAINIGDTLSGHDDLIRKETERITGLAHMNGAILKLWVQTDYLTGEQIEAVIKSTEGSHPDGICLFTGSGSPDDIPGIVNLIENIDGHPQDITPIGEVFTVEDINTLLNAGCTSVGIYPMAQVFSNLVKRMD